MTIQQGRQPEQSERSFPALSAEEFWEALEKRDAAFDGEFWYGVRSTGVYCRPSCPSRQPKRENVAFFTLPDAASRAGLRPCQRCRPDAVSLRDPRTELIRSVCLLIDESVEEKPDLAFLSRQVSVNLYHLQRLFKKLMGISPRQYAEARRAEIFKAGVKGLGIN